MKQLFGWSTWMSRQYRMPVLAAVLSALAPAASMNAAESGPEPGKTKNGRTEIGDTPWDPTALQREEKVIYGADDRIDVYQETNNCRLEMAASTCGLLNSGQLTNNGNGTYSISTSAYTVSGRPACAGEPYGSQPTAMFCTGFLVGEDLIATAGHCYDQSDLSSVRFVFGFKMSNSSTAVTTVNANQVYQGVQVVGHALAGELDYAVIRVDRKVTAPGVFPLPLRRSGTIAVGTDVGVIGHPAGLPMKIAFGAATEVKASSATGYFEANLDTYGGNSGSPVFNQVTGVVEGILVRGAQDYVVGASCFTSNQLPDSSGQEDVSKASTFIHLVPETSNLFFDKPAYSPGQTAQLRLNDANAPASVSVTVTSSVGDVESVTMTDGDSDKRYSGSLAISGGTTAIPGNNILEAGTNGTATMQYVDASNCTGGSATQTATATVDTVPPTVTAIRFTNIGVDSFTLEMDTNEQTKLEVSGSVAALSKTTGFSNAHVVAFTGLNPCTDYALTVKVTDLAGNFIFANPSALEVTTMGYGAAQLDDDFEPAAIAGWTHSAASGADNWLERTTYSASPTRSYGYSPGPSSVADASLVSPTFTAGPLLEFKHTYSFESGYDGGVVEISTNGGSTWTDLGSRITSGGYTGTLSASYSNPIGGRQAWTGGSFGTMTKVTVDLTGYSGSVKLRFRFGSDSSTSSGGWYIDDVRVSSLVSCEAAADAEWLTVE